MKRGAGSMALLLDGVRTPFGKYLRDLSSLSSRQLGAFAIKALMDRLPSLAEADGVLLAQVLQGGMGQNPARQAAVDGGIPMSVPAMTLNSVCLGGMAAVADAARRIQLGEGRSYVVGGMDSMSRAPHAGYLRADASMAPVGLVDTLTTDGLWCALSDRSMGALSDRINVEMGIDRDTQDNIAQRSHNLARAARDGAMLGEEIAPITVNGALVGNDGGIREDASIESLAQLEPVFDPAGTITAGNASQLSDGASVGAVVAASMAEAWGVAPLARVVHYVEVAGPDASLHLKPAAAIRALLSRSGLSVRDLSVFEINEAFAGVVEASRRDLSIPLDVVNVNGGAIALGHPLGGTGFRLVLTAARELSRRGERYAVAAMCGGGGQGAAVLIENVNYR